MDGTSKPGTGERKRNASPAVRGRDGGRAPAAVSNGAEPVGTAGDDRSPARRSFDALMESRRDESRQVWEAFLGPLLSKTDVRRLIGAASAREVDVLVAERRLLALPTHEGDLVYPAFQFRGDGQPYPVIARVIEILQPVVESPYSIASWLRGRKAVLGDRSPIEWLALGRDPRRVVAEARLSADHFAHS